MRTGPLLGVFAHPDDETFGVGGTLAKYAAAGIPVTVVTATRGELSTLGRSHLYTAEELAIEREVELRRAGAALGIADVRVLGYPDGGLRALPREQLARDIGAIIRELQPAVVLTFHPDGITGHPDHVAVAEATTATFAEVTTEARSRGETWPARLFYWVLPASVAREAESTPGSIWTAVPDEQVDVVLDTRIHLIKQFEAIACHRTQSDPPPAPLLARLAAQRGREYFILARSTIPGDYARPDDLYASPPRPARSVVGPTLV